MCCPSLSCPRQRVRSRGFSLVEILVVMAVIVLLLTALLPAMRGIVGSTGRRGAVNTLLGTLDQARAVAISEGRATYVVFLSPKPNGAGNNNPLTTERSARCYAIFADPDDLTQLPQQRSGWVSLPTGIAFKVDEGGGKTRTLLNRPLTSTDPQFYVPTATGTVKESMPYVKFDATGATDLQDSSYLRLLLFEGSVTTDTGNELPVKRAAGSTSDPTVQRFVWEEVRLNYATGRARYTADPADISVAAPSPSPTP